MVFTVPIIALAVLTVGVMPIWPHSRGWGWPPAAILGMGLATMLLFSFTVTPA